ncbi:MAG: dihydroorotase [Chitinispirillales bacterium]|jgi:dihydroorotase|nr:dihydroorotase [Chitinispirillales bacterium]
MQKIGNAKVYLKNEAPDADFVLKNVRVINPQENIEKICDVAVCKGKIVALGEIPSKFSEARKINLDGCLLLPGMIDLHTNLREPGREDKETIESGTSAAVAGGFTAIACMPNTDPITDAEQKVRYIIQRSENAPCRVYPIGAATKELKGEEISPFYEMFNAGARGVSDGTHSIVRSDILKNVMNYAKMFDKPVFCNCQDVNLSKGVMNEGEYSTILGLRGSSKIAEDIDVSRHLITAQYTGCKIHITRVSSKGAIEKIREYKEKGVKVTAATAPHYLYYTDKDLLSYDTNLKVSPPIRTEEDRAQLLKAIKDGTIDAIVSDHAPHTSEEKNIEFDNASFGVAGLETLVGAVFTEIIHKKIISLMDFAKMMCVNPYKILGLPTPKIAVGERADLTVISPNTRWKVDTKNFFSKCANSAFLGKEFTGMPVMTIVDGKIMFERECS